MKENTIDFVNKLIEKSTEAFIMGLEIYNKPTIKYRVEGFSFFICNAWELMLKAHIIKLKGENAIYYKDSEDRTLNLENCIKIVFSDKNGSLRKNLERIIDLRNTSTHFVTEDYEYIYAPLFQACVINYVEKMKEFHNSDITNHIAQNFLTLSTKIEKFTEEEIRARYSVNMAKKLIKDTKKIESEIRENNSEYAIPIEARLIIVKDKGKADVLVAFDKNADSKLRIAKEIKNPNEIYKHTTKDVVRLVNRRLKSKKIFLNKIENGEPKPKIFNKYDLNLFIKFYDIKTNEKYCFYYRISNRYGYSQMLIEFIVEEILKNPDTIIEDLKKGIKKIR